MAMEEEAEVAERSEVVETAWRVAQREVGRMAVALQVGWVVVMATAADQLEGGEA